MCLASLLSAPACALPDVTIMSRIIYSDGLCRIPLTVMDMIKDVARLHFMPTGIVDLSGVDKHFVEIIKNTFQGSSDILFFCDALWYKDSFPAKSLPPASIKIAYSMLESSAIPAQWVTILNTSFDLVVVPDQFLVDVYQRSGVTIPIFVLPLALDLDPYLQLPAKAHTNDIFTFGMSGGFFSAHKNHELLVDCFYQTFGNNPRVKLKIHGRWGNDAALKQKIKHLQVSNIQIINGILNPTQMLEFYQSLDCYVSLSKGEGFSNTPREALSLGIPCILTNNSAHQTICATGLVCPVAAHKKEPASYSCFGFSCGYFYDCSIPDVCKALKDVYMNYQTYHEKALQGREWAKRYSLGYLKDYYCTLVRPERVILSHENKINRGYLQTNSQSVYAKYRELIRKEGINP